jgi:hypothetical protein
MWVSFVFQIVDIDFAAAQYWDDIMQRSRGEKPQGVN